MEIDYKKIDELLKRGVHYGEVADILEIDIMEVINYANKVQVKRNEKTHDNDSSVTSRKEKIKTMLLNDKMSIEEIASKLGVSTSLIKEDLLMMGIAPNLPSNLSKKVLQQNSESNASSYNGRKKASTKKQREPKQKQASSILETRNEIATFYRSGMPIEEIYEAFSDISPEIIDKHIRFIEEHDIMGEYKESTDDTIQGKKPKKDFDDKEWGRTPEIRKRRINIYRLYGKMTKAEIAKELGVSIATISADMVQLRKIGVITSNVKYSKKRNRREEIKKLYSTMSIDELAERFGVARTTILADILHLTKTGKIENLTKNKIEQRRKIVASLYGENYISELAEMLGVSTTTINDDIRVLKREGVLDNKRELRGRKTKKKQMELRERRKKVASLYGRKSKEEIAEILGVSLNSVARDIIFLEKQGIIKVKNKATLDISDIRSKILELYGTIPDEKIEEQLGVSLSTVKRQANDLIAQGFIKRKRRNKNSQKIEQRRQKVAKLIGKKTRTDIADELGVSAATITEDIRWLKAQGIIKEITPVLLPSEKGETLRKRRETVAKLYGKCSYAEIARRLGVSYSAIYNDISILKANGIIKKKRKITSKGKKSDSKKGTTASQAKKQKISQKSASTEVRRNMRERINEVLKLHKAGNVEEARVLFLALRRRRLDRFAKRKI